MAAVRVVVNFHVKPGRYADLFEGLNAINKIVGRLGASMVVNRQAFGPEPGNTIAVVQYQDWAAFAKAASDPEFERLLDTMRNNANPAWEGIAVSLNEEIAL